MVAQPPDGRREVQVGPPQVAVGQPAAGRVVGVCGNSAGERPQPSPIIALRRPRGAVCRGNRLGRLEAPAFVRFGPPGASGGPSSRPRSRSQTRASSRSKPSTCSSRSRTPPPTPASWSRQLPRRGPSTWTASEPLRRYRHSPPADRRTGSPSNSWATGSRRPDQSVLIAAPVVASAGGRARVHGLGSGPSASVRAKRLSPAAANG